MGKNSYLLSMLMLITAFSYFDRFVFSLMLEPIKNDLSLSDSQLGVLGGFGFAVFYALAGIPIARWADRDDRVKISALSIGLLGLMVSLCSMVTTFSQLLIVRAGVAIGEAGVIPASQSLVADTFDRVDRPKAMARLSMSYSLSVIAGFLIGGWLIESVGWRLTFVCIGLPGVIIAIVFKRTLKDLKRCQRSSTGQSCRGFLEVLKCLWEMHTFRHLMIAFCAGYFFFMGMLQWLGAFFMRTYHIGGVELGVWLALSWGVFGLIGTYLGGFYAARFARGDEKRQMRSIALSVALYFVFSMGIFVSSNSTVALFFLALSAGTISFANGPVFAAIQSLVQSDMRSVTVALLFLFSNLIGMGLGPLSIGVASDSLSTYYGTNSLRYALLLFCPGSLWVACHYWFAGNTISEDIKYAENLAVKNAKEIV